MYENKINLVGSLSKVILLIFVFNMKKIFYEEKQLKKWLILFFCPVTCIVILIYILPFALTELNFTITRLIIIIAFLSLMLNILLIHFLAKKVIIEKQKNDLKTLEKIKNANTEKFLKIRNNYKDTEKLAHDMKKHIDYIYYADSLLEVKQYISSITQKNYSNLSIYTGNFDIDTILTIYEKDIKIISTNTLPNIIHWVSGVDLNVIIGNVIENAIRYSSYIKVSFKYNDNWLLISAENYTDKNSKKIIKGLGTLNIEETLEKYDGNLKYKFINNIFYTDILLQNQILQNEVR